MGKGLQAVVDHFTDDKVYAAIKTAIKTGNQESLNSLMADHPNIICFYFYIFVKKAIRCNQETIICSLINFYNDCKDKKIPVNSKDIWANAIDLAIQAQHPNLLALFIKRKAPLPFDADLINYSIQQLDWLLQAQPELISHVLRDGNSLLGNAALCKNKERFAFLLEKGADPFFVNRNKKNPDYKKSIFDLACDNSNEKNIHLLLHQGVSPSFDKKYKVRNVEIFAKFDFKLVIHLFSQSEIATWIKEVRLYSIKSTNPPWGPYRYNHHGAFLSDPKPYDVVSAIYGILDGLIQTHRKKETLYSFLHCLNCKGLPPPSNVAIALEALLKTIFKLECPENIESHLEVLRQTKFRRFCDVLDEAYIQKPRLESAPAVLR